MKTVEFSFTIPSWDRKNTLKSKLINAVMNIYPEITIIGTEVDGSGDYCNGKGIQFAPPGSTIVFKHVEGEPDVTWYKKSWEALVYAGVQSDLNLYDDIEQIFKNIHEFATEYYPQYHTRNEKSIQMKAFQKMEIPEEAKTYHLINGYNVQNIAGMLSVDTGGIAKTYIPTKLGGVNKFKLSKKQEKTLSELDRLFAGEKGKTMTFKVQLV